MVGREGDRLTYGGGRETFRQRGVTVLLVEHHMQVVMGVSDRILVLNFGRPIAEGTPAEIRENPAVNAAYLGTEVQDAAPGAAERA